MNALGFVFCVLTVLSIAAVASHEKLVGASRLRKTFVGHAAANRQVVCQAASEYYASLKRQPSEAKEEAEEEEAEEEEAKQRGEGKVPAAPRLNPECSRLNLFPLIDPGVQEEPVLYEAAAKLLRVFYGDALFEKKSRAEYKFLDAFLKAAKQHIKNNQMPALEQISFHNEKWQAIYYRMLKGTKQNDLLEGIGYPALMDYIRISQEQSKLCLYHAHPNLLAVYFTPKGAGKLFAQMHAQNAPQITREDVERICRDAHLLLDPLLLELFDFQKGRHPKRQKSVVLADDPDSAVSLRKTISIPSAS
jgi:hypothetical protein